MIHYLKTWPSVWIAVVRGAKTAEVRLNDRDYQVGDTLRLVRFCPNGATLPNCHFDVTVTHILHGFGLKEGYVMLSFIKRAQ